MTTSNNNPPEIDALASTSTTFGGMNWSAPASIALLLGNLLPIAGVLLWDWDVRSIVTLYWSENLILGAVTLAKLFHLEQFRALPNMLFFLVHYGAFCGAHGLFIAEFFAPAPVLGAVSGGMLEIGEQFPQLGPLGLFVEPALTIFGDASTLWWWAFCALSVSHGVSFLLNYLGQGEYLQESVGSLMSSPYSRILVLQVTVVLGGLAVTALGSTVYLVVALVVMKIFVDLVIHNREHRRPGRAYNPTYAADLTKDENR